MAAPEDLADVVTVLAGGLRLTVRAKPGMSRARPPRLVDIGEGKRALEITVAAAAEDGKANQAIIEQLAGHLGVRKSAVTIKSGDSSRLKIVEASGAPAALLAALKACLL